MSNVRSVNMQGLNDDQIREKKLLMKECETTYPYVHEWFRELVVDMCIRDPEFMTKLREGEFDNKESAFSVENMKKLADKNNVDK